jgi:hypothetical protein
MTSSNSGEAPHELEFVDSTLHETLVTFSDAVTIDDPLGASTFTFPSDHSVVQSLI